MFVFTLVREFGALVLSTVTTTRKFFTILVSVFLFGNALSSQQWIAVGMVFFGLGMDIIRNYRSKRGEPPKQADKTDGSV